MDREDEVEEDRRLDRSLDEERDEELDEEEEDDLDECGDVLSGWFSANSPFSVSLVSVFNSTPTWSPKIPLS